MADDSHRQSRRDAKVYLVRSALWNVRFHFVRVLIVDFFRADYREPRVQLLHIQRVIEIRVATRFAEFRATLLAKAILRIIRPTHRAIKTLPKENARNPNLRKNTVGRLLAQLNRPRKDSAPGRGSFPSSLARSISTTPRVPRRHGGSRCGSDRPKAAAQPVPMKAVCLPACGHGQRDRHHRKREHPSQFHLVFLVRNRAAKRSH